MPKSNLQWRKATFSFQFVTEIGMHHKTWGFKWCRASCAKHLNSSSYDPKSPKTPTLVINARLPEFLQEWEKKSSLQQLPVRSQMGAFMVPGPAIPGVHTKASMDHSRPQNGAEWKLQNEFLETSLVKPHLNFANFHKHKLMKVGDPVNNHDWEMGPPASTKITAMRLRKIPWTSDTSVTAYRMLKIDTTFVKQPPVVVWQSICQGIKRPWDLASCEWNKGSSKVYGAAFNPLRSHAGPDSAALHSPSCQKYPASPTPVKGRNGMDAV